MNNINLIFQLPNELVILLFTVWLKMKDVCVFDTSLCDKKQRVRLLNIMKLETIFDGYEENLITKGKYLNWLIIREMSIKKLIIKCTRYISLDELILKAY